VAAGGGEKGKGRRGEGQGKEGRGKHDVSLEGRMAMASANFDWPENLSFLVSLILSC
jgi:hypothetical protein